MRKNVTSVLLIISLYVIAAVPTGYYNGADGKNTSALRSALQTIITNGHSVTSYSGLWTAYSTTDRNSSGKIWDMYSNCSFTLSSSQCGTYSSECDCYNREHTSPQSWFGEASPMVSDLFNVYPTDGKVNGMRSNYPYGEVGTATYTSGNGCKLGTSGFSGYSGVVFEPIDQFKGDFARTYFYMATRYASVCESWIAGANVVYGSNLGLTPYAVALFLKWSRQDPVSAKEIARNDASYNVQNNRNPFIDYPGLEEYIWGNNTSGSFSTSVTASPYLSSPTSGATVDFGKVTFQQTDTASVYIKGVNLTGDLTIALSGANASYFTLATSTISQANAAAGYKLVVNYSAQAMGLHTAQLSISGGGITTTSVILNATATDGFLALAASNISNTGFNANWTSSANATGYKLDVFSMVGNIATASKTLLEEEFLSTTLPVSWVKNGYVDNSLTGNMKLASGSQIGTITSPSIDMSAATTLLVRAKQYGSDAGAKLTASVDNQELVVWTTGVDNQDFTVSIPVQTSTSKITLSAAAGSGNRLYIDYVKVTTQGTSQTPVSVTGYPKSVGSVLTYQVNGLLNDSTYYYTVTPEGNATTISDRIKVLTTSVANGINTTKIVFAMSPNPAQNDLKITANETNITYTIYNLNGQVLQVNPLNIDHVISVSQLDNGMYFLQLKAGTKKSIQKFIISK